MESESSDSITVLAENCAFVIQPEIIDLLCQTICTGLGLPLCEISWDFVESETIQSINLQFRQKNQATDVLSFPQEEWPTASQFKPPVWPLPVNPSSQSLLSPPRLLGDVIICPEYALKNAKEIGHELDREAAFLLVHGILHLTGHDHVQANDEQRMIHEQKSIMTFLETIEAKPLWTGCCEVLS